MSASSNRSYKTSKTESERTVKELSLLAKVPEKAIRKLLNDYTVTEIRNGRKEWTEWIPLESVIVHRDSSSHVA